MMIVIACRSGTPYLESTIEAVFDQKIKLSWVLGQWSRGLLHCHIEALHHRTISIHTVILLLVRGRVLIGHVDTNQLPPLLSLLCALCRVIPPPLILD